MIVDSGEFDAVSILKQPYDEYAREQAALTPRQRRAQLKRMRATAALLVKGRNAGLW
jgi:hypothetical protein